MPLTRWEAEYGFDTPAIVVDLPGVQQNIREMAAFAQAHGVSVRPHIKTHKSGRLAQLQLAAGAAGVTVAKVGEAEAMAAAGVDDIFIAYQVVGPAKLRRVMDLARRVRLSLGIDSLAGAALLSGAAQAAGLTLPVLIEVDTGLGRCGLLPGEPVLSLARQVQRLPGLRLQGLVTHAGHAYKALDPAERKRIGRNEGEALVETAALLRREGMAVETLSVGSTPTAQVAGAVPGITEIRPGTYIFYDTMQVALGVVPLERCAAAVVSRIISRPAPDRAVIDAGSKVLALDQGAHGVSGVQGYGRVLGHPGAVVERLSEEHGVVRLPPESPLAVGDHLVIIPNHICPVINLVGEFWVKEGDQLLGCWPAEARGLVR